MPASVTIEDDRLPLAQSNGSERVNILLVDDQPAKLLTHESILAELGQNLIKARNGREALECLLKDDFAVILLDVKMPEIDGFETAQLIRQRPRFEKTPIIFVTGYNTTDIDRLKGYSLGAVDYLFLPIIPEVLKAKVSVFVELARQTLVIKRQAENLAQHNQAQSQQLQVIQTLNEELRNANRELESFSYTVSHDLRSPLRALNGYAQVMLEDYGPSLDSGAQQTLQNLKQSVTRMDLLTRDLLEYTRIARQAIALETIQLEELIQDVISMNPTIQNSAEVTIRSELLAVRAHPTLLQQCLSNLLDNAAKFVAPGVTPRIQISTEAREGDRVRISIQDNGVGIDPAYHEKIFGIFERVGDVKKHEGTGIGLAIVARAVQRMGGKYGVDSCPGEGSRFWIELASA